MKVIELSHLFFLLLPIGVVAYFYYRWVGSSKEILYATLRMVSQLFIIGYLLVYIFNSKNELFGFLVIAFMISVSSWIALRNIKEKSLQIYQDILLSIFIGGTLNLLLVLYGVIDLEPLYQPRFIIPLAGMIYANAMNAISLASERFEDEKKRESIAVARAKALKSSLIPQINSFFAVGLVSLPGMMTGQILSGVDPIIAVRYQIVVMAMVLGSAGGSVIFYLWLQSRRG